VDNRPRLDGHADGASVLAIRDALLSPCVLPGIHLPDDDEPSALMQVSAAVAAAASRYWAGDFTQLAAIIPALLAEARLTAEAEGPPGSGLLARASRSRSCPRTGTSRWRPDTNQATQISAAAARGQMQCQLLSATGGHDHTARMRLDMARPVIL
jgi:hypothetical protein